MDLSEINITDKKIKQFESKGITSVEELLRYFPRKYIDFRELKSLDNAMMDEENLFYGVIQRVGNGRGGVVFCDILEKMSQSVLHVTWFNQAWLYEKLAYMQGEDVYVGGALSYSEEYRKYQINNPLVFTQNKDKAFGIYPVYSAIKGMSMDYLASSIETALSVAHKTDKYDAKVLADFKLVGQYDLYRCIHKPETPEDVKRAKVRLIFEELYDFAYQTELDYVRSSLTSPYIIRKTDVLDGFIDSLSYSLTNDQAGTLNEILGIAKDGNRINALIQGDVGCGKTIVAVCLMIAFAENGYQSVLLAPTSVLAEQHYLEISGYCEKLGFKVAYLVNGLGARERKKNLKLIESGEALFIVGTHSVLSDEVVFNNLGLVVTDEEHRFGVDQRERLLVNDSVHSVTMSATPIPRSLGLTMYGKNMRIYTIKTMPGGRKKVKTQIYHNNQLEFEFIKQQVQSGRQAYIVCAMKEEKEDSKDKDKAVKIESVDELKEMADIYLSPFGIKSEVLTGSTDKKEKNEILARFTSNETQILIATTVVEVGVNVPNASVIVIRNADRFGLATLHQLRGRVGRGSYQSYCLLDSEDSENERLKVIEETNDGFVVAQKDLEQRGSGDFIGTKQSGENKCAMLMLAYPKYYQSIERYVEAKVRAELRA